MKCCAVWGGAIDLLWQAKVEVTLKEQVLDPQGAAVEGGLKILDYHNIERVRVGKYIELIFDCDDREKAASQVEEMARRLLSNPVIEDFNYTLLEVEQ